MDIVVFCGSKPGTDPQFMALAADLGTAIATHEHRVIYGAGRNGLMGAVAQAAEAAGGEVLGYIPDWLAAKEGGTEQARFTATMTERKQKIIEHADAVMLLPGGIGTADELFEVLVLASLEQLDTAIVCVGPQWWWTPFQQLIEHMHAYGFLYAPLQLVVAEDVETAIGLARGDENHVA